MQTFKFDDEPGLGAEVEIVKPFCKLTKKMDVPSWKDIVGDFADKTKPGLAGRKFSRLCGFTFKTKFPGAPTKMFQIVYVPKLRGMLGRNWAGLSGWYCWTVFNADHRDVTSIAGMKKRFNFDVNKFFHTDLFEKYLPIFQSNVAAALDNQVQTCMQQTTGSDEKKELARYVKAIKDSLSRMKDVQQFVTVDDIWDDVAKPDYAKGSAPKVGNAKIAYNADKTYGLVNTSQKKQREEILQRAADKLASKKAAKSPVPSMPKKSADAASKSSSHIKFDPALKDKFGDNPRLPDSAIFDKYDDYDDDDVR